MKKKIRPIKPNPKSSIAAANTVSKQRKIIQKRNIEQGGDSLNQELTYDNSEAEPLFETQKVGNKGRLYKHETAEKAADAKGAILNATTQVATTGSKLNDKTFLDKRVIIRGDLPVPKIEKGPVEFIQGFEANDKRDIKAIFTDMDRLHTIDESNARETDNKKLINTLRPRLTTLKSNDRTGIKNLTELKVIDPFVASIHVPYETDPRLKFKFDYQFADSGFGYLKKIYDPVKELGGEIQSDEVDDSDTPGDKTKYKYSKKHKEAGADKIVDLMGTVTKTGTYNENKEGLDAYTILGGEAPRWVAVKEMANNLKMSTRFYIEQPGEALKELSTRRVYYVTFVTLYRSWNLFNRGYNISNGDFALKLASANGWEHEGRKDDKTIGDMTANDKKVQ